MDQLERQKELSMAVNGRMALLIAGIMNIVTAVTSSALYSANMFVAVNGVVHGNKEFMDIFSKAGMSVTLAVVIGLVFAFMALLEIFSGVCAVRFSNRLDKANFTARVANILLILEILSQIFLIFVGMMSIPQLVSVIILPLIMMWGASKLRKLARKYPDRIHAVEAGGAPRQSGSGSNSRSLHDRAVMKAQAWDEGAALAADKNAVSEQDKDADLPEQDGSGEADANLPKQDGSGEADADLPKQDGSAED